MLERLHGFWTRLGIKPAVGDTFITALVLIGTNWIITGEPLDVNAVRLAVGLFVLGAVGVAAPPEAGSVMTRMGVRPRRPR